MIPRGFSITRTIRIERIGLALFAEAGTVADSVADFPDARIHTSYGIGLRVGLERTATFRVDLGFSGEGPNFILSFGLPFRTSGGLGRPPDAPPRTRGRSPRAGPASPGQTARGRLWVWRWTYTASSGLLIWPDATASTRRSRSS